MKKPKKTTTNYFEVMEEAGKKHGIKVTDMSKRGIRAIGFLSGVGGQDQRPDKPNSPNRSWRRRLTTFLRVLT
jgi:hypothetical protein